MILLDTSILIDYFRKKDKTKSVFFQLSKSYHQFAVSTITVYEIYSGAPDEQIKVWDDFFAIMEILPFNSQTALLAARINIELKKVSKQINVQDLFIAATAINNNMACATLNKKHFGRIEKLILLA